MNLRVFLFIQDGGFRMVTTLRQKHAAMNLNEAYCDATQFKFIAAWHY